MKELHVIVHEEAVESYASLHSEYAARVLAEIAEIKSTKEYLEIPSRVDPHKLHPNMPPPTEDLQVIVSGGYLRACATMQLFALKQAGYTAEFHPTAVHDGYAVVYNSAMLKTIKEKYPDFYDSATF